MSDAFSARPWQRWLPDDLAAPLSSVPDLPPAEHDADAVAFSEEDEQRQQLERMQQQMRKDAQTQGYSEGYQKGFAEAQQNGYDAGFQQGLADAQQQQAPLQARMQQLVTEFHHTLEALDSVIASRLMRLALEAARQVIGHTPPVDNSSLIKQIQGLLQQEPLFSGKPQLRVHPDDLQRVEEMLGATLSLHGWRLRGDPTLHHGGCKVSADEGDLDASVATRWQELCRLAAPGVV